MNPFRNETAEFFAKAKELGLVDEVDQKLEALKHERRLAVIARIKALPTEAETDLPALGKACTAAHKALELAEEAHRAADRAYKDLSQRLYGTQLQFDAARGTLEREAQALAPDFLRVAYEDLSYLDSLVSKQLRFDLEIVSHNWLGKDVTQMTSNSNAMIACHANIKNARSRIWAMILEDTARETAQAEVATLFAAVEKEAYSLGVKKEDFAARRKPVDVVQQAEDAAAKEAAQRRHAAEERRARVSASSIRL